MIFDRGIVVLKMQKQKDKRQRQDSNLRGRSHMISSIHSNNGVRVIPINHSGTLSEHILAWLEWCWSGP